MFVRPYSSLHSLTSPPLGLTVAFNVAAVCVIEDAAPVTTVGDFGSVVIDSWAVPLRAVGVLESVTLTVKLELPAPVGVPVMAPVVALRESPPGNEPAVTDQV